MNFLNDIPTGMCVILAVVSGLSGALVRIFESGAVKRLYEASASMDSTDNAFVKQMKKRYGNELTLCNTRKATRKPNPEKFVDSYLLKYRYVGVHYGDYARFAWLFTLICVVLGLTGSVLSGNIWYLSYGAVCAFSIVCVGKIEDSEEMKKLARDNFVEYFKDETDRPAKSEEAVAPVFERTLKPVTADGISKGKLFADDKNFTADKDFISTYDRKLVEEILKEYLN